MYLSGTEEWDFSQISQIHKGREWLNRCTPLMVVGLGLGATARVTQNSPRELKRRIAEHHICMREVMGIRRQGGRAYYHEFPVGADSINTKEALAIRGREETREVDVGEWRIKGQSMGRVHAITNVADVAEELQSAGVG